MKKYLFLFIMAFCVKQTAFGQNIGINATGATPNASAMLDVSSTTKGMLVPRMTTVQRSAIASPAEGLQVYDTDLKSFLFYNGNGWIEISTGSATNYWGLNGTNIFNTNTGNVGIGINTPLAPLHIKNDREALRIEGSSPYITFYDNTGTKTSFLESSNNNLYIGTPATNTTGVMQFYVGSDLPAMTINPAGEVMVGDNSITPFGKLTVQTLNNSYGISQVGEGGNILATRIGGVSAGIGTFSNTAMRIFSNSLGAIYIAPSNQNIGLGTDNPMEKLTVVTGPSQYGITHTDGNISVSTIVGTTAGGGGIGTKSNHPFSIFTNNGPAQLTVATNGYIGIGTVTPTNKLQIGSVGATGFATNDFAIGNGTNAVAIYETDASTLIGATNDIILKPRNNGHGRVGINTSTPRAPLDVVDETDISNAPNFGYSYLNLGSAINGISGCSGCTAGVSIYASNAVYASEFDAYSDARIKNIAGLSNTARDLETINALAISDYTMIDRIRYGNKAYKKVIAQQVEKFYPQVVSKHADFIPNVYQLTTKIEKVANGYLLSFPEKHNISNTAKKLQLILSGGTGMQQFDIVSIPSDKQVLINAEDLKTDKLFVYGEEVNDFRTVDYEGLTTLNISATQELSKRIASQNKKIEELAEEIKLLKQKK